MDKTAKRIAIVVSDFNDEITGRMEQVALKAAKAAGATVVKCVHVPGAYDIPVVAAALASRKNVEAVVTLGAIIKGDTRHDELIARECARALTKISLKSGKPVTLGVMGPGITHAQAGAKAEGYAQRAAEAALNLLDALAEANKGA